jgi:signal transduction histidine kinase/DNA-binding NarL/FixJ family response regulator
MPDTPAVKILVVDDLPEKLLVYQTVLEEPAQEVICARSGSEALQQILHHDFAVILLDVNMPDMSGFETAALIRSRRRCAHTPIIFITAFADELHALEGYSYGAVDYILSPVVPDILRTKVRVFVQLFRLHQQVRTQAAREVARAEHEHACLAQVLETATDFFAQADAQGRIIHINRAGRRMLGLDAIGDIRGRLSIDDLHMISPQTPNNSTAAGDASVPQQSPADRQWLDVATREGVVFGESCLTDREGRDIHLSHVLLAHYKDVAGSEFSLHRSFGPDARESESSDHTSQREVESFSLIARDISDRKKTEAALARHRAELEQLVQDRTAALEASLERLRAADRLASIGTLAAGLGHDMGNLILPVRLRVESLERGLEQSCQEPERSSWAGSLMDDVGAIKTACEYLQRLSRGLRLFAIDPEDDEGSDDTTDLTSWWMNVEPFLRSALPKGVTLDRLSATGDRLSAVGCRLSQADRRKLAESQEPIAKSRQPTADSQQLPTGQPTSSPQRSDAWHGLPAIAMPPHRFTQAIYNLVQNAGDALRERGKGSVTISAQLATIEDAWPPSHVDSSSRPRTTTRAQLLNHSAPIGGRQVVLISVCDDGPGMTDAVRKRCMEPFFTTKTRGISTGLGLALVHGAVAKAGGTIELITQPGHGTSFRLALPTSGRAGSDRLLALGASADRHALRSPSAGNDQSTMEALVRLSDRRLLAYALAILRSLGVTIRPQGSPGDADLRTARAIRLVVLDDAIGEQVQVFLRDDPGRRAIILSDADAPDWPTSLAGVIRLPVRPGAAQLRAALEQAASEIRAWTDHEATSAATQRTRSRDGALQAADSTGGSIAQSAKRGGTTTDFQDLTSVHMQEAT